MMLANVPKLGTDDSAVCRQNCARASIAGDRRWSLRTRFVFTFFAAIAGWAIVIWAAVRL